MSRLFSLPLGLVVLALMLSACTFYIDAPETQVDSRVHDVQLQSTESALSSGNCPVTPVQTDFWGGVGPVAGEFPIWISSSGGFRWSQMGAKVHPPDSIASDFVYGYGRGGKTLIFVDQTVKGDLTITGRRLDAEGTVYFLKAGESSQLAGSNDRQLNVVPSEVGIIVGAHTLSRYPNPPGMAHHGFGPLYPNPGCYELTAAIEEYEVSIVIEITATTQGEGDKDKLPEELAARISSVDRSATRLIGRHADQTYWRATSQAGDVCVIGGVEIEEEWIAAVGCASEAHFQQYGIFLTTSSTVTGLEHFTAAIMLPDGYAEDAAVQLPHAAVMPNLVVFDAPAAIDAAIEEHGHTVSIADTSEAANPPLELNLAALLP